MSNSEVVNGHQPGKKDYAIILDCEIAPLEAALASLTEIAQRSPKIVQGFLGGLDYTSQLVRVDSDTVLATGASEFRIKFQPSDLLIEFLAATRARECDGVRI